MELVDLTDQFCDAHRCYAQIGSVIVYRDKSHMSREYSTALAPYIAQQLIHNAREHTPQH
ncbi:MAG: SGNH hydrolase domain-containing protein [Sciscionella sp.]